MQNDNKQNGIHQRNNQHYKHAKKTTEQNSILTENYYRNALTISTQSKMTLQKMIVIVKISDF
jgi:hypothetical protein